MISVLIHDYLENVGLDYLHDLSLHLALSARILNNLLDNPASIAMKTNEEKFPFSKLIDMLFLFFRSKFDVFLHDVVAELIVNELRNMDFKILKYLILEKLVACLKRCLDISGTVLISAPFCNVMEVIQDFILRGICRKIAY
jgi:hypothetical protein